MKIQEQIKLIRRLKADIQKEQIRSINPVLQNDLAEQITGLDAVIATLTETIQLLNALEILGQFNA